MKLCARTLLTLAAPLIMTACATIAPPQPPSLDLPKSPTDLRAVRKGDRVMLTWTVPTMTTDRQSIRTSGLTVICRARTADLQDCGTPVGKLSVEPARAAASDQKRSIASYIDTLPNDLENEDHSASATYAIEVLNADHRGAGLSNRVHVPLIRTLPPPQNFQAQVTSEGVVLTWTADVPTAPSGVRYAFRILRRHLDPQEPQSLVAEVPAANEQAYTFTDSQIEWQKTYEYHAEAVTLIAQANKPEIQVEGEDTPTLRVFVNDVFPPAVPAGLQAAFSGPGQQRFVDLVWAPVSDVDLAGYNIYRHIEGEPPTRINTDVAKTPAYRDANVESGKRYFYSVTAVDLRGNESAKSEEASEMVPQ